MIMIRIRRSHGDERLEEENHEEEEAAEVQEAEEAEEEEALSLCDLPVKQKLQQPLLILNQQTTSINIPSSPPTAEDFDFNHWPPPPPMCAADDVFFQGHMLPLRLSFTSDYNTHNNHFLSNNLSTRSESMDHNMFRFRNGSSSSSSSRSHYSRSSSISNNSISIPTNSKPRAQNNNVFHSHPSPTPQIRSFSSSGHRSRRSSRWDFFRLGLLRTPGMELHDLKTRTTTTTTTTTTAAAQKTTASFLGVVSCKKSIDTIPSPSPPAPKNRSNSSRSIIVKKRSENGKGNGIREKEKDEKETRLSHRRTFEWLKQLSHASFADEEQ